LVYTVAYLIITKGSITFCAYPFDTWSPVYYDGEYPEYASYSNTAEAQARDKAYKELNSLPKESPIPIPPTVPVPTFDPEVTAVELYKKFKLASTKESSNVKAALSVLSDRNDPLYQGGILEKTSNCTKTKIALYLVGLRLSGGDMLNLATLIVVYDLYATGLELNLSPLQARETVLNLPVEEFSKELHKTLDIIKEFKKIHATSPSAIKSVFNTKN